MKKVDTGIEGLWVIEPQKFGDARGFFMETYHKKKFAELGLPTNFVQDNHSRSARGILRGLHFQKPNAQGKLVRCTRGAVYDVAIDIRPESKTFGKYFGLELSEENAVMFYIPPGFAHGFYTLSDVADFQYKCTELYSPQDEGGLAWNDPAIGIKWPLIDGEKPLLNDRDSKFPTLAELKASGRLNGSFF